jgi:hypothetical protein
LPLRPVAAGAPDDAFDHCRECAPYLRSHSSRLSTGGSSAT